ncbi:MAG: FkbM family methyltransferase [Gammaproteobacteria bacterium]
MPNFIQRTFSKLLNPQPQNPNPNNEQKPNTLVEDMPQIARIKYFEDLQIDVHPGDIICEHIRANGSWEDSLSERLIEAGKSGGLMIDVGANVGYFSLLWAKANPENKVYAFEASPRIYPKLIENVTKNGLSEQIYPFSAALSQYCQVHEFVLGPEEQTGWGGLINYTNGENTKVLCVRLDELITDEKIRLMKIDVEGADTWVLKGCEKLLREHKIEEIYYEQNIPRMMELGIDPSEAGNYLKKYGFKPENITPHETDVTEWHATL